MASSTTSWRIAHARLHAVLEEMAAQWQQTMGTRHRVEQETVSSQNLANAIENINKTRSDATGNRLRLKDGKRVNPKSWSGNTPLGGLAREVAAWVGYVDPKHEAGKLIQRITKGTLRATEAWTDGRHAEDDKHVELDYELAVALVNVTEGAARATVLKVTQTEPSHGFVAWQALIDGSTTTHTKMCALSLEKRYKPAREQVRKDQTDREHGIVEKELMNGRVAGKMTEARKEARRAPRAANLIGMATRTREAMEAKEKARARVKPDTATIAESKGVSG